ncbi:uncharacterized protein LOC143601888 [Bidens hawaiensis]|uniref:uncharacterized protein LOC143601888 n=1 Tax=Bidens hawaiensis TaxID=980011 RepID=UPI00404B5136
MRIRKRLLSLYGAITPPPSDLTGGNHHQPPLPPVQHPQLHQNNNIQHVGSNNNNNNLPDPPNQCHRPLPPSSSAHTTKIGLQPSTWTSSGDTKIFNEMESESKKELIGKESIVCAEANNHDLVMKGWLQGDRLIPTKKKRGSYGRRLNNDVVQDNNKIMSAKKNKSVIMEGSRCSRVNGRGWRCSQQTLVGYSLCEHHLGKGRVRGMNSGRAQTVAPKEKHVKEKKVKKAESSWDHDELEDDSDADEDVEGFKDWNVESMSSVEGAKVFSKKKKLGMVKARSLSSLLSQI